MQIANAQITLYDNLELEYDLNSEYQGHPGPRPDSNADRFSAQHFSTTEASVITSASFAMSRTGSPTGTMYFDIYDKANGRPGTSLGRLGSHDIETLPTEPTTFTIEGSVTLEPNTDYYLVTDMIDADTPNFRNSFFYGVRSSREGTMGADRWLVSEPNSTTAWFPLSNFLTGANYLRMRLMASLLGDFDDDGTLSASDIDLLSAEIRMPTGVLSFDVNGDGSVNLTDHEHWVTDTSYANTLIGDANFDGMVDFPDFLALSASFGQDGGWAEGDFDGSGRVEFPDFLALSANFGEGANAAAAAVPEPTGVCLAAFGILGLIGFRRCR